MEEFFLLFPFIMIFGYFYDKWLNYEPEEYFDWNNFNKNRIDTGD